MEIRCLRENELYEHGILTLTESGYSVFLLKIPLFQGGYTTFNDFEAV